MENQTTKTKNNTMVPLAIIIAGILIAGAVLYNNNGTTLALPASDTTPTDNVRTIDNDDHVQGNPNASVKIVEYSDFECPFCKRFHDTMNQVMDEYGKDEQVAWIYRHFPLDQLHPIKARAEAMASECVNEIGGNGAFWQFADRFFELTPSNNQTDIETVIPYIVREIGIDEQQFNTCMNSGKYDQRIESDIANAIETGGRGTPWSIIIAPNGTTFPVNGAQPYGLIKQLIEIALKEK
jgi:protein-disulfide isomerase